MTKSKKLLNISSTVNVGIVLTIIGVVFLIAAIVLFFNFGLAPEKNLKNEENPPLTAIAKPVYPDRTDYHSGGSQVVKQSLDKDFLNALQNFLWASSAKVLATESSDPNQLYSPISLYMALAMAADGSKNNTQMEILKALSMDDLNMSFVNEQTHQLFKNLYFNNEIGNLKIANSLWLSQDHHFNQSFLQKMSEDYYAYVYHADFKTEKTSAQINQWIADHTSGRLGTEGSKLAVDSKTMMALINTTYFHDEWMSRFPSEDTKEDQFYLEDGSTVKGLFMNLTVQADFIQDDRYSAASLRFKNGGEMTFILPDEGISPYELAADSQLLTAMFSPARQKAITDGEVIFKVPRFQYNNSEPGLKEVLTDMGLSTSFTTGADFSGFSKTKPLFISDILQHTYLSIDEKGCEAAAYTAITLPTYGGPQSHKKSFELTLNRSFIFVITQDGGNLEEGSQAGTIPLFIGIVNNPFKGS